MATRLIFIPLLMLSFALSAQQDNYDFLVTEMCNRLDVEQFRTLDREGINTALQTLGKEIRDDHQSKTDSLLIDIHEENPGISDSRAQSIYLVRFLEVALDSCDKYGDVIVMSVGDCPTENDALLLIKKETEEYLEKKTNATYMEQYYLVMNQIDKIISKNEEAIIKDYPEGAGNRKLIDDAIIYLSYKSKPFLKVIILGQIQMGAGG